VVLADVAPGTKLPLGRAQSFTYSVSSPAQAGQIVRVSLGRRSLRGVVLGQPPQQLAASVKLKSASIEPWQLPPAYLNVARDVAATYRVSLGHVLKLMLPPAGPLAGAERPDAAPTVAPTPQLQSPATLNVQQRDAAERIAKALSTSAGFLLYGVTGSGKTEVYLEVARRVLGSGGQVLLLVPEIAMTPQLGDRLRAQLGDVVVTWHSGLTPAERRRRWAQLATGKPALLLGPRSAAFVPLPKLGLIVVDEAHDGSYKQADQEPHFHAGTVVRRLARHASCPMVFGTATPSVELWHATERGTLELLRLPERHGGAGLPAVELVDVRGSRGDDALSPAALEAISAAVASKRQSLVLINRRGASRTLLCKSCGHVWRCSSCERSMVLHDRGDRGPHLACHYCDRREPRPSACPTCGDVRQVGRGAGTQSVEAALQSHLPGARIARLDRDVARSKARMREVSAGTLSGDVDVLVGTQLVAKGWDIERLDLVVVLEADQGLSAPDLRSHERTAQLLWQVAGRAGRRATRGRVLVETRQPDHPILRALQHHDYERYLSDELAERKRLLLPPFRRLVAVTLEGSSDATRRKREADVRAAVADLLRQRPELAASTELWPGRDVTMPRGRVVRRCAIATSDVPTLVAVLPLDAELDVDPEEL